MRTATPPAATRRETGPIAAGLDRARQAGLAVAVDGIDTIEIDCPRCAYSLVFAQSHWQPTEAARHIDLFVCIHTGRRR